MMSCIIAARSALDFEEKKSSEKNSASGIVIECGTFIILAEGSDTDCYPYLCCEFDVLSCYASTGLLQIIF